MLWKSDAQRGGCRESRLRLHCKPQPNSIETLCLTVMTHNRYDLCFRRSKQWPRQDDCPARRKLARDCFQERSPCLACTRLDGLVRMRLGIRVRAPSRPHQSGSRGELLGRRGASGGSRQGRRLATGPGLATLAALAKMQSPLPHSWDDSSRILNPERPVRGNFFSASRHARQLAQLSAFHDHGTDLRTHRADGFDVWDGVAEVELRLRRPSFPEAVIGLLHSLTVSDSLETVSQCHGCCSTTDHYCGIAPRAFQSHHITCIVRHSAASLGVGFRPIADPQAQANF